MSNKDSLYINECVLGGVLKKAPVFRQIDRKNEQCIIVLELLNAHGEAVNVRLVAFDQKTIDQVKLLQLNEGDAIKVSALVDVIRWSDIKTQTIKSRQSIIITQISKLG